MRALTAEIAVMNKQAIAIAADSAVTIAGGSDQKIFTTANKIFSLSKYHPVAIMVYGSANFMQTPWETIIKIYRKQLKKKSFNTLYDYADNFIKYIESSQLFTTEDKNEFVKAQIYGYFVSIRDRIMERIDKSLQEKDDLSDNEVNEIIKNIIDPLHGVWDRAEVVASIPADEKDAIISDFLEKYRIAIDEMRKEIFELLPLTDDQIKQLDEMAIWVITKMPDGVTNSGVSGIVFAGFGENEIYPSLVSFEIEGLTNSHLKYKIINKLKISIEQNATIVPFAQSDMVYTFMEGVDPNYEAEIERFLSELLSKYPLVIYEKIEPLLEINQKETVKQQIERLCNVKDNGYLDLLKRFRRENNVDSIINVVAMLPKDQLGEMAETLVNLTSFKRRVTMEAETVGGPVDVAVISKGDGFIWIKRKHYFKPELNPQFTQKYYMEED